VRKWLEEREETIAEQGRAEGLVCPKRVGVPVTECNVQQTGPQAMAASVLTTLALAPPTYQLCILIMCKI
jgi:hypothetical protein